jgi:creatinine amidohydrolase
MSVFFGEKSWPELKEYIDDKALAIIPFGTVEEHGHHLPVNTDLVIAEGVAQDAAEAVKDIYPVLVLPGFWSGYSVKKMTRWPGVIRVRSEVLIEVWFDIMASLVEMGFRKILCINSHGQNPEMIKIAARRILDEYNVNVVTSNVWSMAAETMKNVRRSPIGGALHGGEFETSLMLYYTDLVDMSKTTDVDRIRYRSDFYPGDAFGSASGGAFISTWCVQESETGLYGDPTLSTKETGRLLAEGIAAQYKRLIEEYMRLPA